jgi:hypothetical protein
MSGVIPPLPQYAFMAWYSVIEKHRENFYLRNEHALMMTGIKLLRRIFGPKGEELRKTGENCIIRNFKICTVH